MRSLHRRGNASRFAYRNRLHFDLVQRCLALRCQPTPFTQVVSVRSRMAEHFALYRHAQRPCARAVHRGHARSTCCRRHGFLPRTRSGCPCACPCVRGNVPEHIGDPARSQSRRRVPHAQRDGSSAPRALVFEDACVQSQPVRPGTSHPCLQLDETFSYSAFTSFPCSRSAHQPMARTRTRAVKTLPWRPRASWLLSPVDAESA